MTDDDGLALGTPVRSATTKGLFRICGLWPHRVELVREGGGTRPFRVDRKTFGLLYRVEKVERERVDELDRLVARAVPVELREAWWETPNRTTGGEPPRQLVRSGRIGEVVDSLKLALGIEL